MQNIFFYIFISLKKKNNFDFTEKIGRLLTQFFGNANRLEFDLCPKTVKKNKPDPSLLLYSVYMY